jgi:hypothetical protein
MKPVTRRNFLRFSAAAAAIAHLRPSGLQELREDKAEIGIYVVRSAECGWHFQTNQ